MNGQSYLVPPLSRKKIWMIADKVRADFTEMGWPSNPRFPIVEFLDKYLPAINPNFAVVILGKAAMGGHYGVTYPENDVIYLREDVYEEANGGNSRHRFTLAHELGHYLLHSTPPGFARSVRRQSDPIYRDSEWQANTFAGGLLFPSSLARSFSSPEEAANTLGISTKASEIQLQQFRKEGHL